MENLIIVPIFLITASVAVYIYERFYKVKVETIKDDSVIDYKGIEIGQCWKRVIDYSGFSEDFSYEVIVTGLNGGKVLYRHKEGFIVAEKTIKDFLYNATLVDSTGE